MASPAASIFKPHGPPAGSRVTPWPATRPSSGLGNQGRAETHEHQFVSASQPRETGLPQALHPLPARNEWGEDRGEGKPIKTHLLSPPSPPSDGGEGNSRSLMQPCTGRPPAPTRSTIEPVESRFLTTGECNRAACPPRHRAMCSILHPSGISRREARSGCWWHLRCFRTASV